MTFTLSISVPDELLDGEQADLVSSILFLHCTDLHRWKSLPTRSKLRAKWRTRLFA